MLGLLRQQQSSKAHEEVDNIVALFTHPAEELDVAKLAFGLTPALVETKSRVRHADMEEFAVVESSFSPGKATLLFKAVDAAELEDNRDRAIHVAQARLARKTLVKLGHQGFVKYIVLLPSSHHNRGPVDPWHRSRLAGAGPQDPAHSLWIAHKG